MESVSIRARPRGRATGSIFGRLYLGAVSIRARPRGRATLRPGRVANLTHLFQSARAREGARRAPWPPTAGARCFNPRAPARARDARPFSTGQIVSGVSIRARPRGRATWRGWNSPARSCRFQSARAREGARPLRRTRARASCSFNPRAPARARDTASLRSKPATNVSIRARPRGRATRRGRAWWWRQRCFNPRAPARARDWSTAFSATAPKKFQSARAREGARPPRPTRSRSSTVFQSARAREGARPRPARPHQGGSTFQSARAREGARPDPPHRVHDSAPFQSARAREGARRVVAGEGGAVVVSIRARPRGRATLGDVWQMTPERFQSARAREGARPARRRASGLIRRVSIRARPRGRATAGAEPTGDDGARFNPRAPARARDLMPDA